ncbi:MAG: helicase HerA-like domain-containing protein, partial [Nanoarchaeota archaeon]
VQLVVGSVNIFMSPIIKEYLPVFMSGIIIIFILFAGGYYFVYIRRKLFEKKMEEKKKSSIYPFPDFFALPKSKYAYIGMVADANVKTHLDHTQLNRHTLIAGGTGSGKTVAGMVIAEELLKKGLPIIVFDPVGQWTGFAKRNTDSAMKALYRKFKISGTRAFKPTIIEINEKTMSLDIMHYLHNGGLTVLKLDGLTPLKADMFIEKCLNTIYRAKLSETGSLKSLIVLDEVHRLLPKYGGRKAYLRLEQAVREFRKWGVGLLMISQVLTDFKGAIRGNIGTEIQLHTKYEGDIKRVRERHGSVLSKLISRLPVGIGMIESGGYNKGLPYFVEFRPLLHSPYKLNEKEIKSLTKEEKPILLEENVNLKKTDSSGEHKELGKNRKLGEHKKFRIHKILKHRKK